jgi:hypothetical protein
MISKKQLINAAKEFNTLPLDPPIDTNVSVEELTRVIRTEVLGIGSEDPPLIGPDDQFSPETMELIDTFMTEDEKKEEVVEETEIVEEKEVVEPPSLKEEVDAAETLKELKAIATTDGFFKEIRGKLSGYRTADALRAAMLDVLKEEADALRAAMLDVLKEEEESVKAVVEKIHEKNIASKAPKTSTPVEKKEPKKDVTPKTATKKKESTPHESNEDLALRLLKEEADAETIQAAFNTVYVAKGKNITKVFLEKRIKIYMDIARRKVEVK